MDKSIFGYSFNEAHHTLDTGSFKGEALFFFSQGSLCVILLEFGFLSYPKLRVFTLRRSNGNSLCVFTLRRLNGNSLSVFTLWWINGNWLVSVVWKFTMCWLFWRFFLITSHGRKFASLLTHTWTRENEVLPCPYHLAMIIILLTTIVGWFLLTTIVGRRPPSPSTRRMYRGVIFPRHTNNTNFSSESVPLKVLSISLWFQPHETIKTIHFSWESAGLIRFESKQNIFCISEAFFLWPTLSLSHFFVHSVWRE